MSRAERRRAEREAKDDGEVLQEIAARAVRRLDLFEYVILGAAALLALVAGAVVAFMVAASSTVSFFPAWTVASLLFFLVPALVSLRNARRQTNGRAGEKDPPSEQTQPR